MPRYNRKQSTKANQQRKDAKE